MPLLGSKTGSAFHSKCKLMFLWRPTGPHYVPCLSSLTSCYSPTPILMQPHCPPCFSFGTLVTFLFLGICCRYPMCLECSSPVKIFGQLLYSLQIFAQISPFQWWTLHLIVLFNTASCHSSSYPKSLAPWIPLNLFYYFLLWW